MDKLGVEDTPNYSSQKATVSLFEYGKKVANLYPERRVYKAGTEPQPTSEVAIYFHGEEEYTSFSPAPRRTVEGDHPGLLQSADDVGLDRRHRARHRHAHRAAAEQEDQPIGRRPAQCAKRSQNKLKRRFRRAFFLAFLAAAPRCPSPQIDDRIECSERSIHVPVWRMQHNSGFLSAQCSNAEAVLE